MATASPAPPKEISRTPHPTSRLAQTPWRAFFIMLALQPLCFALVGFVLFGIFKLPRDLPNIEAFSTATLFTASELLAYWLVPFLLHLPNGNRTFREYLDDIRLTKFRPFVPLLALTISCDLILILCQGTGSIVYRLTEGKPVTFEFIEKVFNLATALPPQSMLLFAQMFSSLEEVAFRGVLLTMLLRKGSPRNAIIYSAAAFGLLHLPGVFTGTPIVFVLGQVVWAFLFGLFYGYIFIKSGSLLPSMAIHWLSNVFQAPLTAYLGTAPIVVRAVYGVVFGYGLAAGLLILWVRHFSAKWLPAQESARAR